jgi:hypothetical protein
MVSLDRVLSAFLTRQEAEDLLQRWLQEHTLHCVLVHWLPFEFQVYPPRGRNLAHFDEARIDLVPFTSQAKNDIELTMPSRESLRFIFPQESEAGLVAGSFGTLAKSGPRRKLWIALVQQVVDATKEGMWVHNTSNGNVFFESRYRYSQQAALLHSQGMPLRESSGSDLFSPEKPSLP